MSSEKLLDESSRNDRGQNRELAGVVEQNIDSIVKMRLDEERRKGAQEHTAEIESRQKVVPKKP
ncbi:MAG: hypothetical protein AABN33_11385 [Acidobacteriota bacterium]